MRITLLAGGIGGARFTRGLLHHVATSGLEAEVTLVVNTGDDIRMFGLQLCPDLDSIMYTLGGGISEERGWGREDESFTVMGELAKYGVEPTWFGLGDRDLATHIVRTQMLTAGYPLSAVTEALCARWQPGVRLLPMSDDRLETHVVVEGDEPGTRKALHFQEWWVRHRASLPALAFPLVGIEAAKPAPGVLEAISGADVVLLPPSNPVVSIGTILQVPGVRDALRGTAAPVVGASPIVGGAPVRGMADACLTSIGVDTTAEAVARHYGARAAALPAGADGGGILDGWLVDDATDSDVPGRLAATGITARAVPLMMTDVDATAAICAAALALAEDLRR